MHICQFGRNTSAIVAFIIGGCLVAMPAKADNIVDTWASTQIPSAPQLKPFKAEQQKTALLLLDFSTKNCNQQNRPRCLNSIPQVAKLLRDARAHGVLVVYSTGGNGTMADLPVELASQPADPVVKAGVDKFLGTDLEKILKDKDIHNVIITGTSAHGAVLYTASAAALRAFNVVVPVDGMSAEDPFAELSTAWILTNSPASVSAHITLTQTSLIAY